jgi:hypothetical protein
MSSDDWIVRLAEETGLPAGDSLRDIIDDCAIAEANYETTEDAGMSAYYRGRLNGLVLALRHWGASSTTIIEAIKAKRREYETK